MQTELAGSNLPISSLADVFTRKLQTQVFKKTQVAVVNSRSSSAAVRKDYDDAFGDDHDDADVHGDHDNDDDDHHGWV